MCGHIAFWNTHNAPPFYTDKFRMAADSILNNLHTTRKDMIIDVAKNFIWIFVMWCYESDMYVTKLTSIY